MPTPHGSLALLSSLSAPLTVNLFYWYVALKSRFETAYVVSITRFRALRARGAREAGFFHGSISFVKTVTLFYWYVALKSRFETTYVVSVTRFRALRARGACEAGFFFMDQFLLLRRLTYFNDQKL